MFTGQLVDIFLTDKPGTPLRSVEQAEAVPGRGLAGDRYFLKAGTFSKESPDREVTLIEAEALEALGKDYEIDLPPVRARRNLLTRGVPLNHLVGREFAVGAAPQRRARIGGEDRRRDLLALTGNPRQVPAGECIGFPPRSTARDRHAHPAIEIDTQQIPPRALVPDEIELRPLRGRGRSGSNKRQAELHPRSRITSES